MKKTIFILAALFIFITVSGCGFVGSKMARFTTDFKVLTSDSRILYEPGAETLAEEAARHLSQALKTVESRQFGTFREPVKVYAFADTKSFAKFAGVPEDGQRSGHKRRDLSFRTTVEQNGRSKGDVDS